MDRSHHLTASRLTSGCGRAHAKRNGARLDQAGGRSSPASDLGPPLRPGATRALRRRVLATAVTRPRSWAQNESLSRWRTSVGVRIVAARQGAEPGAVRGAWGSAPSTTMTAQRPTASSHPIAPLLHAKDHPLTPSARPPGPARAPTAGVLVSSMTPRKRPNRC